MKTLAAPGDRAELTRRLSTVRPDHAARWGRMTAHQMVCHLADSFLMASGEKAVTLRANPFTRTLLKWVALYLPLRWPPGIPTSLEIDQERGGTKPVDFATDVERLEALLQAFAAPDRNLAAQWHPWFGAMSDADWRRWGYLHMDHHLRQFDA